MAPSSTVVVCAFGDSITDGTLSTLNGDDRWPNVFSRRLHAALRESRVRRERGHRRQPYSDARQLSASSSRSRRALRAATSRPRSFGLSGLSAVVLLEGINDISAGAPAEAIIAGMKEFVSRVKARGITIVGATITSSLTANGNSARLTRTRAGRR